MNCQESAEIKLDVLYGEAVPPRQVFAFHAHLHGCPRCRQDYLELIETRESLAHWTVEEVPPAEGWVVPAAAGRGAGPRWSSWWPGVQKVAAAILIVVGLVSLLQSAGLGRRTAAGVSEEQLAEMIHDVMVARQVEDWKVIGSALLSLKEEVQTQNRAEMREVFEEINAVERRYVEVVEENNRLIQTMLTR